MRATPPTTRVDDGQLTVTVGVHADDGTELAPYEVRFPRHHADLLDATATPGLPALVTAAVSRGEDLVVEGSVDARAAAGAVDLARRLAERWDRPPISVEVAATHEGGTAGGGTALFLTRGVDSWSTLLDELARPAGDRVTHLLAVFHGAPRLRAVEAAIIEGHRQVATELGLELVVLSTTVRPLLDPYHPWDETSGPALISAGLTVAAGFDRLVLTGANRDDQAGSIGSDPLVVAAVRTTRTEVVLGNRHRDRDARVAHLLTSPLARRTLQVCWVGEVPGNCGRCRKCQLTMSQLLLAGDPEPTAGFDGPLDPSVVRTCDLPDSLENPVRGVRDDLPPDHEDLRRAWADAWATSHGQQPPRRWGEGAPPGLAGPGAPSRVAAALRLGTGRADAPAVVPLGWRTGTVALRPALADHHRIRALAAGGPGRARAWAVVEPHLRHGQRDGTPVDLAGRCHDRFGPGACYVPGVLWAPDQGPALPLEAVARLLRTARCRLWWRADGDLDPLRLVETIEQGCLPLQVMPAGPAADLASDLAPELAVLVVADEALDDLDLSREAVAILLEPAVDVVLAGSAERDLGRAARA